MSTLPRSLAPLLCLLLACSPAGVSKPTPAPTRGSEAEPQSPKLRLVSSTWPPFVDTAEDARVALDLVISALARAGYIAVNEIVAPGAAIDELQAGHFDGSAALWRSEEREQFLLYSDPYLENRLMLVGRKGSDAAAASLSGLQRKKVGIVEGYAYGDALTQGSGAELVRGPSTEDNLRALLQGKLDYVLADALVLHQLARHYPKETREHFEVGAQPVLTRTLHLALRKDLADAPTILERFNQELARMLRDGSYHDALHVDWIHADVDGDGRLELVAAGDQLGTEPPADGYQLATPPQGANPENHDPTTARFVVKGVPYDSWTAIPDDYKTPSNELGSKPATLRAKVFEF